MYQVRHAPNLFVGGSRYSCKALRPRSAAMTHVRRAGRQSYHVQSIPKAPRSPAHYDLSTLPKGKTWECNGNVYTGVLRCGGAITSESFRRTPEHFRDRIPSVLHSVVVCPVRG